MKCVFLLLALAVFSVSSVPSQQYPEQIENEDVLNLFENKEDASAQVGERHTRLRRATCDGGSFESKWFTPHHALCAAHCLVLGHKGGYCKGLICHCRD